MAETIRSLVANKVIIEDRQITVSIGVSELGKGESLDDWIKRGDELLYLAKKNGRNQVFSRYPEA